MIECVVGGDFGKEIHALISLYALCAETWPKLVLHSSDFNLCLISRTRRFQFCVQVQTDCRFKSEPGDDMDVQRLNPILKEWQIED